MQLTIPIDTPRSVCCKIRMTFQAKRFAKTLCKIFRNLSANRVWAGLPHTLLVYVPPSICQQWRKGDCRHALKFGRWRGEQMCWRHRCEIQPTFQCFAKCFAKDLATSLALALASKRTSKDNPSILSPKACALINCICVFHTIALHIICQTSERSDNLLHCWHMWTQTRRLWGSDVGPAHMRFAERLRNLSWFVIRDLNFATHGERGRRVLQSRGCYGFTVWIKALKKDVTHINSTFIVITFSN